MGRRKKLQRDLVTPVGKMTRTRQGLSYNSDVSLLRIGCLGEGDVRVEVTLWIGVSFLGFLVDRQGV